MNHLLVKNLPSELSRLSQNLTTILCVCVVSKIRTLIEESFTFGVHHNAERITVFLKSISDSKVTKFRCIAIPSHCMTSRPVTVASGPDVQCHLYGVACVVFCSAYL